jgi:predicted RNase H-like HicB family nuclease
VNFKIEFDQEEDGRWIAEISELPGVMAYGASQAEAEAAVEEFATKASLRARKKGSKVKIPALSLQEPQ